MSEHVMYARETTWGTYVPTSPGGLPGGTSGAIPVETFNVAPNIAFMDVADTGPGGRGRPPGAPGQISVAGALNTKLYPQMIPRLIASTMKTRVSTAVSETTGIAVTASSIASPTVITVASTTGYQAGQVILLAGHTGGTPSLNGLHYITSVVSATQLQLDVAVTVAGTWTAGNAKLSGYRNKLLFNDDLAFDSLSFQKYFDPTKAELVRGAKITRWGVGLTSGQFALFTSDWVGKDATKNGGIWADATVSPAVVPYTHTPAGYFYPPAIMDPLKFYQASIRMGGSTSLTAGELVVTGGTARCELDNFNFSVDLGVSTDAYGICLDDRTVQAIDEGPRIITMGFDPNFRSVWFEFYDMWKANPQQPLIVEAYFRGPSMFTLPSPTWVEYKFTFPNVRISSAPTPDQNAAYGLKRQTVAAQAAIDGATGADIGVVYQGPENLNV